MQSYTYHATNDNAYLETVLRMRRGADIDENELTKFRISKLPPIIDKVDLSIFIGIDPKLVEKICIDKHKFETHYREFRIRKKNGSMRIIYAPRTYLKVIQWWILHNILNYFEFDKNIFGFVPGRNIVQNAEFHFGARHILNIDIKDFFPSITIDQVKNIFLKFGYSEDVSNMLSQICCLENRVPQGAPTSPALGNFVLRDMDKNLTHISKSMGLKYSRYADDLTFSSTEWIDDSFLKKVVNIINAEGFEVNKKKTRFAGPQDRLEVTGVVINSKIQPPRKWRKRVRAILNQYGKKDTLTRQNLAYLYGIMGVAGQYRSSVQMHRLSSEARKVITEKRHTVIGYGNDIMFPRNLTELQAMALCYLSQNMMNVDIAKALGVSKSTLGRILRTSYVKINVDNRHDAMHWAKENL